MGAEMLARKKLGTKDSAVSRPSPLSEDTKIAFHSSSFGTTASASEDSVIPVKMLQPSRSTISCALRTASAGLPPVSSISSWIGRPRRPPLAFCIFVHSSQPRFSCCPTEPSGPVRARGAPIFIGSAAAALRMLQGIAKPAALAIVAPRIVRRVIFAEDVIAFLPLDPVFAVADPTCFDQPAKSGAGQIGTLPQTIIMAPVNGRSGPRVRVIPDVQWRRIPAANEARSRGTVADCYLPGADH